MTIFQNKLVPIVMYTILSTLRVMLEKNTEIKAITNIKLANHRWPCKTIAIRN